MKKRFVAFLLVLIMVLGMLPVSAMAASNSTVVLHPSVNNTVTGVKVKVGDTIDGHTVSKINGYDITVDLGEYNVNNDSFTLPYAKNIWEGVDNNQVDYISWAGGGSNKRSEGGSALLVNGKNTAYYYFKGATPTPTYMYYLYYKYNDGTDSTWLTDVTDRPTAATTFTFNVNRAKLTRSGYDHIGWADKADAVTAKYKGGDPIVLTKDDPAKTIYAVWMPFFELKYDANGGTGAPASQTRTAAHPTVNRVTFTVPGTIPTKDGYTFKGWADSATATTAQYQPGGTIDVKHENSPKTVYAVWEGSDPIPVPSYDDLKSAIGKIQVMDVSTPSCGTENYDLIDNTQSEPFNWTKTARLDQPGKYDVTIKTAPYVAKYNSEKSKTHELNNANQTTLKLVISYENNTWKLDDGLRVIEVKHSEQTPPTDKPEKPTALDGSFAIVCKNNKATHPYKADYIATPRQYTISDVQMDDQGYYVTATVTVAPNLVAYNTDTGANHRLVNEQDATLTITFRYDTEVTGDGNRKWKQQGEVPVVEVICKEIEAPTADELKKLEMAVQVKCVVDAAQQHTSAYGLLGEYDEDYFVGEPKKVGDDWLCDISYDPDPYVAEFNKAFPTPKHIQNDEKIVPVTLIWVGGSWQIKTQGRVLVTEVYTVTFDSYGGTPVPPAQEVEYGHTATKPADPTLKGYTFAFWYLGEDEQNATAYDFNTPVTENITLTAKWNINKYTVTFNSYGGTPVPPAQEVEYGLTATKPDDPTLKGYTFAFWYLGEDEQNATAYDFDTPVTENITLTAKWNINKYTVAFNTDGGTPVPPAQEVEYGLTATEPAAPEKTGYTFDGWYLGDEKYDFSAAVEQNITLTAKWTQNTYTVTFDPNGGNELAEADKTKVVKIGEAYGELPTPTRKGYNFAGWYTEAEEGTVVTADTTVSAMTDHTLYAHWEAKKANVHIMIFKSNDLGTPIVDRAYTTDAVYGDTLDLAEIDPSSYLDFDFEIDGGWYDDGLFNLYKKYVSGEQANKPAALTKLQITGNWQNLKLIVTELVPVVYFKSAEALAEYQNDHSKVENIIFTTKARVGSTLPTADAPTATRDGYTFTFWSREGQTTDVTGQTVNGWTNLVANWKVTPHNIYAYARLNSYFAPLTTSEFDTPVTLNEATLSRLGLGSYNSLGYISIGSFTFDAMPLTSDLYFDDDAELSAVAEKLATDIALETGVSDKIAEKIAWTALYKTVNEEDMEPGYPAEAGYQLSGNLNLASVTFRAGAENVENMPAVNYTYDDGAIDFYDFYFAGDTITLPTTEPTREGYSFKGWSVEVIPAENDADHLDADGADDAADETLLKAGDTYTITKGGVIFTAQWEKKTFTVKYYLPDETGAWVEKKMDTVDSVDYATYSLWTPNAEDGYEFSGWYQKIADIGVKAKVEKLYMAKEWKLYGKFTPIEYNIQYVYNDGKATSTNPTTYTVESDTITLADATGADWGKTFLEWHDENGQKITEIPTGSTGNRVITAYWNWPVHLHYLDKDNNEIDSATLYVSELEPGACVLPTGEKTGYDFDGWYEAKKDIGTASHKLNALSIAKKWELYGRYTAKTDVSYTVKYLREGDNKVLAPEKVVTDQTFDTEVTEQAADVVGYTPDAPSKTMILDEYNKVLTFSYSANTYRYEIHYFLQEPDGSYMEKEVDTTPTGVFDTTVTITPDPNRYGAHYSYNSVKSVVSGVVTVDDPATILKLNVYYDLDFHTLTFDTMGGSAIDPVTVRHGNAVARPADPTKDKYTFIGWYVDPEFSAEYDFDTVLEADKTIYAKFELTSTPIGDIYVRYDVLHIKQLPDGSYDLANAEVEHLSAKKDTTVTAVVKDYSATHHINVNSTLSKLTDTAIQPYPGADGKPVYTILSVYYDLDFHTLTFDTMGGSRIDPVTVRHGNAVAKPKDPVNGGYIFDGWYTDKTYRTPYNFATVLTQDTTIYAKWFLIALPGVTIKKTTPKLNTSDHFAYVQGYPDGTVKPTGNITRAETAAILFRLMDEGSRKTYYSTKSGFRDVATGSWYNTYVATLNNAGVITDSSNGYFRPNEAITRAELAAMLANFTETAGAANYFNDVSARYWAANAIAICAKLGWITGYPDGSFRPDRNVTRAELMAMINRATGRAPKSADAFLPGMKTWSDNTADKWYYLDVQEATNSHSYTVKDSEKWTALNADPNWSLYE